MIDQKFCRAEYDGIDDCFEGIPAGYVLAPFFKDKSKKLLIGDPGSGKTHLLKLLAKEFPIQINDLDKSALIEDGRVRYTSLNHVDNPIAMVMDDLHYLLGAMKLYAQKDDKAEGETLKLLADFLKEARNNDAVPIFVADGGPGYLSSRFKNPENRLRFMRMFQYNINDADDKTLIEREIGRIIDYGNVIDLNNRGFVYRGDVSSVGLAETGLEELKGFQNLYPELEFYNSKDFFDWFAENVLVENTTHTIASEMNVDDMPFFSPRQKELKHILSRQQGHEYEIELAYEKKDGFFTGAIQQNKPFSKYGLGNKNITPFTSIRQLKLINNKFGKISWSNFKDYVATQKLSNGRSYVGKFAGYKWYEDNKEDPVIYTMEDIRLSERVIHAEFNKILGVDYKKLAGFLENSSNTESSLILSDLKNM